ncbi:MAG: endonuclease [Ignavibacterium sp.]|nr:endonuclease [Ignavibacterium sp.]
MNKIFLLVSVLISFNSPAQVRVNREAIEFPQIYTSTIDSASFYLVNEYDQPVYVELDNLKSVYSLSDTALTVLANDSIIVWIKYHPTQNVIDKDLIFITGDDSTIGCVLSVDGSGKFGDSYDASTFNLYDTQLKSALTLLVSNHTSLGYNLARDKMFMEIDNQKVNGQGATDNTLECVYTGRLAVGYTSRTVAQNPPYNFNTEHTWPQSNFNEAEPMKSDLYHLYPTDITANSIRSNYPFGKVVSNVTWQNGGSKLGTNSLGQIVFEPRDVHKGDVSRSMFYFITRYPTNYGGFFTQVQEAVFREWNKLDSVGTVEAARNNAIALLQMKRNPYIDHPEFVDRIYSFATNNVRPVFAELNALPLKVRFDSTLINSSTTETIFISNSGSAELIVDSIKISDSRFLLDINNFSLSPYSLIQGYLQFNPDSTIAYNASLTIYSNAGAKEIELTGAGKDNPVNVEDDYVVPIIFSLEQNYPNPFNPGTKINWQTPISGWQTLKVYDVLGNEVATIVNEFKTSGNFTTEFNASNLSSGIYFYQLRSGNFTATKKMTLLK